MSQFRMKRINELVKCELSTLIRNYLPIEEYGVISITEVDVAKNLKTAQVFFSTIGVSRQSEGIFDALNKIRGNLQQDLSKKVVLKYTPQLVFKEDRGLERGQRLIEILDEIEHKQKS